MLRLYCSANLPNWESPLSWPTNQGRKVLGERRSPALALAAASHWTTRSEEAPHWTAAASSAHHGQPAVAAAAASGGTGGGVRARRETAPEVEVREGGGGTYTERLEAAGRGLWVWVTRQEDGRVGTPPPPCSNTSAAGFLSRPGKED
jgi:hypothetical protein